MKESQLHTNSGRKRVGVWIRVSTDEQAQGDSPKHHELRARAYAESKDWIVCEVYDLAGFSGKSVMEYPETKRMMEDIRRGHITGLIFSKLARFARNTIELLTFSEFFQEHHADLISLQEAIDTSTPAGRLFFSVNASLAQFEREEIAARVAASVPIRAKLGKPLGGVAPFGYQWKDKKLIVNPTDAAVRKLVYELFAEHKRKKTVARILNDRGFRTRSGGKFSDTTVTRLITDTTAKGEHRLNYTKSVGNGKAWALKPEHEWVVNRVEPIVPVDLWERCNALLENRRTKGERPQKTGKTPFSGLVRCECGKKMYVPFESPKWVCYACRNKIPVADLESAFREEIRSYMIAPEKVAAYRDATRSGLGEKEQVLAHMRKERDRVKTEADKCFELYQAGALTVGQFKERFQPIDARKQELDREMPRLEAEIAAMNVDDLSCEQVASEGRDFYTEWPSMQTDKKRAVAELLVKEIVVGKEDLLVHLFSLPIFEMAADGQRTITGSSRPRA
jgi:site-specific DNA recombinase